MFDGDFSQSEIVDEQQAVGAVLSAMEKANWAIVWLMEENYRLYAENARLEAELSKLDRQGFNALLGDIEIDLG